MFLQGKFISIIILQATLAQRLVLENYPGGIDNIPIALSVNCDTSGNTGASPTKSNKSNDLTGLQQFLQLQQPVVSPQQYSNINLQQPTIYQTLQQPVPNQNLPIHFQPQFQNLPLNLQNKISQQQDNQVIQKQCNKLDQRGPVASISNSIIGRKPSSSLRVTGVSLAPLPANIAHSRNLPSQASHGDNLCNLGLPSNFPYFAAKSCGCENTGDQIPVVVPRTNCGPISNVPISVVDRTQYPGNVPIPISTSSLCTDSADLNIPIELTLSMLPASTPSRKVESQSEPSIDLSPVTASIDHQSSISQVLLTQSQPFEIKQIRQPVEYQIPPNQFKSMNLDASQTPPAEYQSPSKLIDSQPTIQLQRQIPTSFVSNQNQYSGTLPINYPAPFVEQKHRGPKSSSMKLLLPLLIDLLKERNGRCQYPHNYNCGCINNNVSNSVNNNDTQIPPPEVIEGYTNQRKYPSEESPMSNNIIPEDPKTSVYVTEQLKFRNKNYSEEEDDDEYEDVYDEVD